MAILCFYIIGSKGDGICISASSCQSNPLKKTCSFIYDHDLYPNLYFGLNLSKLFMKDLSYALVEGFFHVLLFYDRFTSNFTFCLLVISSLEKGGLQLDSSQASTPTVHKSIYLPYPCCSTNSGAQYMLVPAYMFYSYPFFIFLANPKSVSLAQPLPNISMF